MKFEINKVIEKETKHEIIDELFNQAYEVKQEFLRDNTAQLIDAKKTLQDEGFDDNYIKNYTLGISSEKVTGFYIHLPKNLSEKRMGEISPIFRMFYTVEKESKKIMRGEETALDTENILQNARLLVIECLHEIIDGKFNDKLENDLKINSMNDFRVILFDNGLSKKMSNFIIAYVVNKLRNIAKNLNVDYEVYYDKHEGKYIFKKIQKVYLDKRFNEEDCDGHEIVEGVIDENTFDMEHVEEDEDYSTTFIQYVLENYINKGELTHIQYRFWNDALRLGIDSKQLKEIYSKQQIYQFKKQILKRLEAKLALDHNVAFIPGQRIYKWRTHFERDENGKFIYIEVKNKYGKVVKKRKTKLDKHGELVKEKYYQETEGRYVLVEKYCTIKTNKKRDGIRNGKSA